MASMPRTRPALDGNETRQGPEPSPQERFPARVWRFQQEAHDLDQHGCRAFAPGVVWLRLPAKAPERNLELTPEDARLGGFVGVQRGNLPVALQYEGHGAQRDARKIPGRVAP